ncbi:MAG: hypothetical protein Q9190_007542 [Brigantiaea leucoxantha]
MDRISLLVAENRQRHQGYDTPSTSLLDYEENDPLLGPDESVSEPEDPCPPNPHAGLPVYRNIHLYDEDNTGHRGLLLLANILVSGFEPFQNAPEDVLQAANITPSWAVQKRGGYERKSTTLELAIISESKTLLSSPACQKLVEAVYEGRIVYTPVSFIDIIPDHYKYKHVALYRPRKAPLLNQYRLIVPRTRNILDVCQFVTLLTLYLLVMKFHRHNNFTGYEAVFCIYALGWVLDELASMLEHGWQVYTQNLWSFLDFMFACIFWAYFLLRMYDLANDNYPGEHHRALDILATGAPVLIPRLAFNLMSENMLFVSLRAMMKDFTLLTLLAVWSFAGFLLGMVWLNNGFHHPISIAKWMLWVWFGLDGTGVEESVSFHWLLGPILMVSFTVIGNTLFLTIVVAMLSNTFSTIVTNATAEIQFRRAVLTFEGVKSDAIFAYQPPFNILALCFLLPLKMLVSPRWFHKINVTIVRTLNAPLLLLIAFYERNYLWKIPRPMEAHISKPKNRFNWWSFSKLSVHGGIQAVFDAEPPRETVQEILKMEGFTSGAPSPPSPSPHAAADREGGGGGSLKDQKRSDETAGGGGGGGGGGSLKGSKRVRSDSVGSATNGFREHVASLLHDHRDNPFGERLRGLEESNRRIEEMLTTLCGGDAEADSEVVQV